ncbi:uncharacterized protein LOC130113368 isoform X1 [Lampris incognitus]|uniref:uncharacterized protein LOC130113368 isoform X1 n=1 Tax=Lampris incognitus TaxID=2546036 RepID=UPI0024B52223|nr:uncharacterized protein LOC130113368 isoform X1 [Lampris incognitus]
MTSTDIAPALIGTRVARFGTPSDISSDRGSRFASEFWNAVAESIGVKCHCTTAYHPQANGVCEWFHRSIKAVLWASLKESSWVDRLPWSCWASGPPLRRTSSPHPLKWFMDSRCRSQGISSPTPHLPGLQPINGPRSWITPELLHQSPLRNMASHNLTSPQVCSWQNMFPSTITPTVDPYNLPTTGRSTSWRPETSTLLWKLTTSQSTFQQIASNQLTWTWIDLLELPSPHGEGALLPCPHPPTRPLRLPHHPPYPHAATGSLRPLL